MRIDHHLHTSRHSPDSQIDPLELVRYAREIGLEALVITEHDYQWTSDELVELAECAAPLLVLSGAEISAAEGHFLVYGLPSLHETPPGITVGELLRVVRRHEGAIVAAHPFRWNQPFDAIVAQHGSAFDALELVSNNVSPQTRAQTEALLREHPMGTTGSSDAHELAVVGCYFTELDHRVTSMADFVRALRNHQGRPRHGADFELACGPVD
jgi:predicted metal-dependent phosphoesterase TrpH